MDNADVRKHVVEIVEHVRNKHSASAAFSQAGGNKLIYPAETRWNSVADSLVSYLRQWPILASLTLDQGIMSKILNIGIKNQAQELLTRFKLVAISIDNFQKNNCH